MLDSIAEEILNSASKNRALAIHDARLVKQRKGFENFHRIFDSD